ncbi:MAG: ATP-binding protein [Acidimicrobiia bacterium]|nr:ATP-binding protein [Acidimicrobiia bacterium]MBV9410008.1 ATP-binding protein [Acidimicrobiia bacterium]
MASERVRLRIGNVAKAVLVTGQAYQDPKDALNEFVSNAADEYALAERRGERITILLRRKGRSPVIAVDDCGRGLTPDALRRVAKSLFESSKAGDTRTLGEKAIGILAFQQLGARCDIVSRAEGTDETWALQLERGKATAVLASERRRARQVPGTTVYLRDLEPEVLRVLTQRKVVEYLRVRRGPALARGDYSIEVVEGRSSQVVTPERPDGIRLAIPPRHTLWGRIDFAIYVAPPDAARRRRVSAVGRAGTTIIDDLAELEESAAPPWTTNQASGSVVFEALQQTAGRRAILRDRDAFPIFVDAVRSVEPLVNETLERVARELDEQTAERLNDVVRRIFARVLKELADLDNPMRSAAGLANGDGAVPLPPAGETSAGERGPLEPPALDDLVPPNRAPELPPSEGDGANPDPRRSSHLPSVAPDPEPSEARSRFDPAAGIVLYNERHADYLLVKDSEAALLDYLATLVAKEYVVYNNPRSRPDELAEEMVRMLVRVRRHIPRKLT